MLVEEDRQKNGSFLVLLVRIVDGQSRFSAFSLTRPLGFFVFVVVVLGDMVYIYFNIMTGFGIRRKGKCITVRHSISTRSCSEGQTR